MLSHPVWVRGLKLALIIATATAYHVAPRVGAWIETCSPPTTGATTTSHPVWVRGLKLKYVLPLRISNASHPVWVRGLKHGEEAAKKDS